MDDISTIKRKHKPIAFQIFSDFFKYPPLFFCYTAFSLCDDVIECCSTNSSTLNHLILLSLSFLFEIASSIQLFLLLSSLRFWNSPRTIFLLGCNCVRFNAKRITHAFFLLWLFIPGSWLLGIQNSRRKVIPPLKEMDGISMYALFPYIVW